MVPPSLLVGPTAQGCLCSIAHGATFASGRKARAGLLKVNRHGRASEAW